MPTVKTQRLELSYRDDGPRDAPSILLLHGWPDGASTWDAISPVLSEAGLRTIAPTTRGFGATRRVSPDVERSRGAACNSLGHGGLTMSGALAHQAQETATHGRTGVDHSPSGAQ
jgi:pimeloyl-ACP methyl ester carboxylesterase